MRCRRSSWRCGPAGPAWSSCTTTAWTTSPACSTCTSGRSTTVLSSPGHSRRRYAPPTSIPPEPPGRATVPTRVEATPGEWVLLTYRMPREPSTPRIAVWRTLKRLGVAQLGDGLVALPADARTREQLDWVAEQITEGGGIAGVWLARPGTLRQERELAAAMATARAAEYAAGLGDAAAALGADPAARAGVLRRLRGQLRRIGRRDYFPPPQRDAAHAAVAALAAASAADQSDTDQEELA